MYQGWRGERCGPKGEFCLGCPERMTCTEICPRLKQHLRGYARGKDFQGRWKRWQARRTGRLVLKYITFGNMDDLRVGESDIATIWNWRNEE